MKTKTPKTPFLCNKIEAVFTGGLDDNGIRNFYYVVEFVGDEDEGDFIQLHFCECEALTYTVGLYYGLRLTEY